MGGVADAIATSPNEAIGKGEESEYATPISNRIFAIMGFGGIPDNLRGGGKWGNP